MAGLLKIGQQFDEYKIVEKLGQGGFGAVYLAQHQYLMVPNSNGIDEPMMFAIKELSHSDQRYIDRFKQEAGVLVQMSNTPGASMTKIYGLKEYQGGYFLIMEFAKGGTLAVAARRQIPEPQLVHIGVQVCKGLSLMHTNKPSVVHRDVKPENIKVEFLGVEIPVKLLDFGVAAVMRGNPKNEVVGTMAFASPAQMRGEIANPWMDQHSVGATLYYMMTDCHLKEEEKYLPFPFLKWNSDNDRRNILSKYGQAFQRAVDDHFNGNPPSVWDAFAEARKVLMTTPYTAQFQAIVLRMITYEDGQKYPTLLDAVVDLERLIRPGQPIAPPQQSPLNSPAPAHRPSGSPPPPPPTSLNRSGAFLPVGKKKPTGNS